MKIKDILPEFDVEKDLNPEDVVNIYNTIIKSGKTKAEIGDFLACADCGNTKLELLERVNGLAKGTIIHCKKCEWEVIGDEWEWLSAEARSALEARFKTPV